MKKALVITGEGLNCESETAHALIRAGADAEIKHLRDLIAEPEVFKIIEFLQSVEDSLMEITSEQVPH